VYEQVDIEQDGIQLLTVCSMKMSSSLSRACDPNSPDLNPVDFAFGGSA